MTKVAEDRFPDYAPRRKGCDVTTTREHGVTALINWLDQRGWQTQRGRDDRREVVIAQRDGIRRIIRLSSKGSGDWQVSTRDHERLKKADHYWALVDVGTKGPQVVVIPEDAVRETLAREHREFLASHGGVRPMTPGSTHQALRSPTVDRMSRAHVVDW